MGTEAISDSLFDTADISPDCGIIPRFLGDLFHRISQEKSEMGSVCVTTSFLELYGDELVDLFSGSEGETSSISFGVKTGLQIREDTNGSIYVPGLTQVTHSPFSFFFFLSPFPCPFSL